MKSKNAERLAKYRARMQAAGFERMSFYGCPELVAFLREQCQPSECYGRTLERLLLGHADIYTLHRCKGFKPGEAPNE